MSEAYDLPLRNLAREVALKSGVLLREGIYAAVQGPNLETRAEYRFLRLIGADVVGMSTVPEVIVARHGGMRVLGLSIITDQCLPDALVPASIDDIIKRSPEQPSRSWRQWFAGCWSVCEFYRKRQYRQFKRKSETFCPVAR